MAILAMSSASVINVEDGNSVVETIVEYAVSSDGKIPPGNPMTDGSETITDMNGVVLTDGSWSTEIPTITEGQWLWTRTRTIYSDGQFTIVYTVSRSGENGTQGQPGVGYTNQKEQWYLSTSPTSVTGGSWSDKEPSEIPEGKYLWGRLEYTMSDGSTRYSDAVYRSMISGLVSLADEINKKITQKVWTSDIDNSINSYDGSTAQAIRDRVTKTEQDIGTITSTVSDVQSTLSTKADGSTVTTLQQTVSTNEQTASQFRQTVQSDYAKLTDVDTIINNIKIGGNNLYVIKDEVPGYIHATSGAISAQSASYKEVTSSFIPVKPDESYILQSWATPTTSGKSWLAYQYYSDNSGTPFGRRVDKYGDTLDSGVEVTADGQEHLTYKITIPNDVSYLRMSYRKYNDGYAMIEKATTPSEYSMNPEDLQNYTDSVVSSAKSEIKQTTDSISAQVSKKVGTDEIIAKINLSPETATIQASKINLLGQVTFEMLNNAAQTRITNVESNANLANDKSNQTLAMKVNYSAFSTANNGECYIHGFNENHEPADVNGYIYWKGRKITVAKTMINPNAICPYYKTIYLVLRLSSTTATAGTLYMVWYNSGWKYAVTPTPSAVGGTWTWNENTDIAIGQFVEPGSDLAMVDTYLYYPPRSANEIVSTADNAYGYAKSAVDWTSANGSNMTNALSMIKKWTNNAVSDTTTIQGGWIATNTITSSQLATNAIMSTNYEASTTNPNAPYSKYGTFLDLSNGNFWTPNFGVINITPPGTNVPTGAWFNGIVYANAGRFGEGSSYWNIESVDDYNMTTHAALVGTGNAYLQTGNWQVNDNAVQTRKYVSTAEYSGQATYYKDIDTNTYYDVGMKIPTDFSQRTSSDGDVTTYNKSFFYGRKYTGNDLPSLDSEWTYFFQVDSQGNIYECGQPLNARYAAIGDVEGQYVSTTGGTVNGNLTVTGTLTATASNATKVGHSLSINNKSFDGSATVNVGTIGVGYGGTGATSFTAGAVLIGNGSNAIQTRSIRNNITAGPIGWTNNSTDNTLITTNTLAYWDGRYNSTASNLEYVKLGKLGTVVTHDIEDFITTNGGSVAELTAGNLIVTGEGRFTNGLYGDLTGDVVGNISGSAGSVENSLKIQLNGGTTEGTNQFTYNGSAAKNINITKSSVGLGNVDNTADANKAVLTATKFAAAQSVTLTGDTTGTASSQAGWTITTKTDRISTVGDNRSVATTPNDYKNKIIFQGLKGNGYIGTPNANNTYSYLVGLRGWSDSSGGKSHELAFNDAGIYRRVGGTTTWENWYAILDSNNYNSYAPKLDGTGATGTWGIGITGNASTATTASYANSLNIVANNEIRFNNKPESAVQLYVGYKWADGTTEALISRYKFMNGDRALAEVEASTFYGALSGNATSATSATNDSAGNNISTTYVKKSGDTMTGDLTVSSATPTLKVKATGSNIVSFYLERTNVSSWRFQNNGGSLNIQNNWNNSVTDYYNVLSLAHTSGNATFKGTVTAPTFIGALTGNASTATTAGSLTTGRDFTIGKTKKSAVKWDGAVAFTQAEISDCASNTANGWMSKDDKIKLDSITVSDIGTVGANSIVGATNGGVDITINSGVATIKHTNLLSAGGTAQGTANNTTLTNGGSFTVPTITYDINGHITATGTNKLTLPSITTITGNAGTATKFSSTRKIELTGDVTGSATTDGSNGWSITATVADNSHYHQINNLTLGSSANSNSLDPLTSAFIGSAASNKSFGLPANAITIQYSTDGGSTWADYGATDSQKKDLFSETRATGFVIGKSSSVSTNTVNNQLRIIIEPTDRYVTFHGIYVWFNTQGNTCVMDLDCSTIGAKDTYTNIFTGQSVSGWSGNNIRYFSQRTFGGSSSQTSNTYKYRITFRQTAVSTTHNSAIINDIRFLGQNVYSWPNNMVAKNHLYRWDSSFNATFPAEITATQFNGNATTATTATTANSLSVGTAITTAANLDAFLEALKIKATMISSGVTYSDGTLTANDGSVISIGCSSTTYGNQIYFDPDSDKISVRRKATSWKPWIDLIHSGNYTSYTVTKTGTGASGTWGISISGNAATATSATSATTATTATTATNLSGFTNTTTSATAIDNAITNGIYYVSGTSGIYNQSDGVAFVQGYNANWVTQIYQDYMSGQIAVRGKNNGTWQAWRKVLDSTNYSSYALPLSGGTMTGPIKWNSTSLVESNGFTYLVGIDAFASGGQMKWSSASNVTVGAATKATQDGNGATISTTYAKLSGATFTGAVSGTTISTSGAITSATTITANIFRAGLSGSTSGSDTGGISLYDNTPSSYGIAMRQTSNSGKHGFVQGNWAIYNYMSGDTNRGFIWKAAGTSVASIDGLGDAAFNGSVAIGTTGTNISGSCSLVMDRTLNCLNFVFN